MLWVTVLTRKIKRSSFFLQNFHENNQNFELTRFCFVSPGLPFLQVWNARRWCTRRCLQVHQSWFVFTCLPTCFSMIALNSRAKIHALYFSDNYDVIFIGVCITVIWKGQRCDGTSIWSWKLDEKTKSTGVYLIKK